MKSQLEIDRARAEIIQLLLRTDISEMQRAILIGMSTALQWVCGVGGSALQDLIDGRPIAVEAKQP